MNLTKKKKLLQTLRQELSRIIGDELDQILLYGSHARGDARSDSDLDVLIILHGEENYADRLQQTSELIARLSLQYDVVISRAFISKDRFDRERSPFVLNVRREGIAI